MEKKSVKITKEMCKVEGGKVFIESDELANAIQNEELFAGDSLTDEEANACHGFGCVVIE